MLEHGGLIGYLKRPADGEGVDASETGRNPQ
jgi:hypothetical protein